MACYHPLPAWRYASGGISLHQSPHPGAMYLQVPCSTCIGCRAAQAKAWALRCHLELGQHSTASFVTLTYEEKYLPPTLSRPHLQKWVRSVRKRLDTAGAVRFFACGEYGSRYKRPHYHALMFGLGLETRSLMSAAWGKGHVTVERVNPARIAYVAGYTQKKISDAFHRSRDTEWYDEHGEVFRYQPPFLQMSRRPGIGGHARQFSNSWRDFAVMNGCKQAVPRFLHESWKKLATPEEIAQLALEKSQLHRTLYQREAAEAHHLTLQQHREISRGSL